MDIQDALDAGLTIATYPRRRRWPANIYIDGQPIDGHPTLTHRNVYEADGSRLASMPYHRPPCRD